LCAIHPLFTHHFFQEDTMSNSLLDLAYQLTQAGKPFVLATVVWCERPTSAKPGAQAIIQENGQMTGWIGGSCAQPVVLREATRVMREGGEPYLLRLGSSDTGIARDNVRVFPMTCASGGVLDIYMEPHLSPPQLLLIGDSPVIVELSRMASQLDFAVTQLTQADLSQVRMTEQTSILVATHGNYDEDALESALRSPARYIGMVGSRRRAQVCRDYLLSAGFSEQQVARLKAPAGLDLGAITPGEIAASILAELVQVRRRGPLAENAELAGSTQQEREQERGALSVLPETAVDPVCGMMVETANARHQSKFEGSVFYFCCPACKRLFERNPQEYFVRER
jgi:xanthine dehydrogenase accessory factor